MSAASAGETVNVRPLGGAASNINALKAFALCRRVALSCAAIGAGIALLALIGWGILALGNPGIGRTLSAYDFYPDREYPLIAMGLDTACFFLILAGAICIYTQPNRSRHTRQILIAAAAMILVYGSLRILDFVVTRTEILGKAMQTAWWGHVSTIRVAKAPGPNGTEYTVPTGIMSPLTAISFCCLGLALLLRVLKLGQSSAHIAAGLTLVAVFGNLWALMAYVEKGVWVVCAFVGIPVAIPTTLAMFVLSVGLVAAEGPTHFLVRPLLGSSARAILLRAFLPATIAIVLMTSVMGRLISPEDRLGSFISASWTLLSAGMISIILVQIARRLGASMERVENARRQALDQLREALDAAEEANRTKSRFLTTMSHELRTPLNAIIGYSEMLQEEIEAGDPKAAIPDMQKIHAAGKHLLSIINDLLDHSNIEAGKLKLYIERIDLRRLIDDVLTTIKPLAARKNNRLELVCPAPLDTINSDSTRIRQCLFNLLSNACKFTENGAITLEAVREKKDGKDKIIFRVRDTGIGLSQEQIQKLFKPFSQADDSTSRKYGGTGLGLSITSRLCEMMGGDVSVSSEIRRGSVFTITLPSNIVRGHDSMTPVPELTNISKRGPKVLIIDDDPDVRDLLNRFLCKEGYNVFTAANGEDGLRLAKEIRPNTITLDVLMPGMDGWEVLNKLKADPQLAQIPVIMVTIVDDKNLGYALGVTDYLTQPVDRQRLADLLKKHCTTREAGAALVAEDDPETRHMLRKMLESGGWTVAEAANGRQALDCINQSKPSLVLLDLMMPEMDGFEFLSELRQHREWDSIEVVVITARDLTEEDRMFLNSSLLLSGCVRRVMQKGSFSRQELLDEVGDLLARQPRAVSPN